VCSRSFWGVILLWDQLCTRASASASANASAGAGAAQKEGSLGWTSGGDQGGSNGADGPVSCRSQGAGPAQLAPKPLWVQVPSGSALYCIQWRSDHGREGRYWRFWYLG